MASLSGDNIVAPFGWEWVEIPYEIIINDRGELLNIRYTAEGEGKIKRYHKYLVPHREIRTGKKVKAYLLWDNVEYALGANPRGRDDIEQRHADFINKINSELSSYKIEQVESLVNFLNNDPLKQIENNKEFTETWNKMQEENAFVVFSISGDPGKTICDYVPKDYNNKKLEQTDSGICLVTGKKGSSVALTHSPIKGVRGTNTTGGAVISFNLSAFNSYGKEQNMNAPVSNEAAFAYTTALNMLLSKDSSNKTSVGDSTIIFWSSKKESFLNLEDKLPWFFADAPKDDPDRGVEAVKALYQAVYTGKPPYDEGNQFYVLCLSPNAARISVRLWKEGNVYDFAEKIKMHFDDFAIIHNKDDIEFMCLNKILRAVAPEYKLENVPPNLAGSVVASVFEGSPYPLTLLHQSIRRIRAERHVNRARAAIIKSYFNRFNRVNNLSVKEITMALDKSNTNTGYLLGRLFSLLEQVQNASNNYKEPNAGIRDRFYGAFSSAPVSVLPILEKLYGHHLGKLENSKVFFESIKTEIIDKLNADKIPAHLTMEQQALFAVGYYHQRQEFFKGKSKEEKTEDSNINEN